MTSPNPKEIAACERKRTFKLKVHADVYALQAMNRRNPDNRAEFCTSYRCPVCGLWHLTSNKGNKPI